MNFRGINTLVSTLKKAIVKSYWNDDQFTIVINDPDQLFESMNNPVRWQRSSIWGKINTYVCKIKVCGFLDPLSMPTFLLSVKIKNNLYIHQSQGDLGIQTCEKYFKFKIRQCVCSTVCPFLNWTLSRRVYTLDT